MIRYALSCEGDHAFEAWFSNSEAYDRQRKRRQVECPVCGSTKVRKQIMAPAVVSARSPAAPAPQDSKLEHLAAEVRKQIESTHEYVGDRFADEARSMFYGEETERPVWGEVTADAARELIEEGVPAMPLPGPFAPRPPKRRDRLN
ncbi:MAG: DUF1178 family protein [Hyphomonadaceae bacterium]